MYLLLPNLYVKTLLETCASLLASNMPQFFVYSLLFDTSQYQTKKMQVTYSELF